MCLILLFPVFSSFRVFKFFFLQGTDTFKKDVARKKKQKNPACYILFMTVELASHNIIALYYVYYACACNIDDFYHIGRIDPPGMVKIVYTRLLHSRKAWAANIAIEWLPCRSTQNKAWII